MAPILYEDTSHAFFCEGESMCEPEHAERCDILYQLTRMAKGLNPNWGATSVPQYGYDQMDNSLTDHKIAIQKQMDEIKKIDLSEISQEDGTNFRTTFKSCIKIKETDKLLKKIAKTTKNKKTMKMRKNSNDEKIALLADLIVEK